MMDAIDRCLLRQVQQGLPLMSRPFHVLGEKLGIPEDEVISRLEDLKCSGLVRRLGGVFDSRQLGYVSALCAVKVKLAEVDKVASVINGYPGVTHNYLRDDHRFNLWFTLTCPSEGEFADTITDLEAQTGYRVHCFPALRRYKIRFFLAFEEDDEAGKPAENPVGSSAGI